MNIYEKLAKIQGELKAPKGQFNSFGKYKYRSAEDILEAVKPICHKYDTVLTLSDSITAVSDRIYVEAMATLYNTEKAAEIERIEVTAYAREASEKKGMDDSQITGTASSYARKYAMNGLFNIDDTKDADTDEFTSKVKNGSEKAYNAFLDRLDKSCRAFEDIGRMDVYEKMTGKYHAEINDPNTTEKRRAEIMADFGQAYKTYASQLEK